MSHTFSNLSSQEVKEWAATCARQVPFIHAVTGDQATEIFTKIIETGVISSDPKWKRETTKKAEELLGIPSTSAYFYAGRVFPGKVYSGVFLFSEVHENDPPAKERPQDMEGAGTPFDSGMLACDELLLKWGDWATDKRKYFQDHTVPFASWRAYFAAFLSVFFAKALDYWESVPRVSIDGAVFHSKFDWQNWTFELRCNNNLSLRLTRRLYVSDDVWHTYKRSLVRFPYLATLPVSRANKPSHAAEEEAKEIGTA